MYTMISNVLAGLIIFSLLFPIFWFAYWYWAQDLRSDYEDSLRAAKHVRRYWIIPLCVVIFFLSVSGIYYSSRNLSEQSCVARGGTFRTWDSGLAWQCFNPDQINTENNLRIIHTEEETD